MIEYSPNRSWFSDLRHLGSSWTLQKLVRASLLIAVYSTVLALLGSHFGADQHRFLSGAFSLTGVILSIVLAFRTNSAYDRWWEGRKLWGTLVNSSRNLAVQLHASFPTDDLEGRRALARMIGNFAFALSGHLRGEPQKQALLPMPEDLSEEALAASQHVPASLVRALVLRVESAKREGTLDPTDLLGMRPHMQAMLEVTGACERIRKTPIPFSYNVFIKLFLIAYVLMLPVGLIPEYGLVAVPLSVLISFALLGLEFMAEEIEDPFGRDCNDLPTQSIAQAIANHVNELLGVEYETAGPPHPAEYGKVF